MTDDEMDEILEQFFSKTDYDFRTVQGWKEFLRVSVLIKYFLLPIFYYF